jgi:predicted transcriptional regulator
LYNIPYHKGIYKMSVSLPVTWKPEKARVVDILVSQPNTRIQEVADEVGVTKATIHNWMKDPEFVEVFYQKYMVTFGSKLPNVLNSMIREAEAGNVQAGRLVLEHSGKLIKRVEVANNQSPFEKFLSSNSQEVEKVESEIEDAEFTILPERPVVTSEYTSKKREMQIFKEKQRKNKKRKDARHWRERAEKANVAKPQKGRQTPAQRKAWMEKVKEKEKALGILPPTV